MIRALGGSGKRNRAAWIRIKGRPADFLGLAFTLALLFLVNGPLSPRASAFEGNAPDHLQCEGMQEPLGIDITHPRFSWQVRDLRRDARQAAYEIQVASSAEGLAQDRADVWDSGRVESKQPVNVPYSGPAVESRRRYYGQVRVWDAQGQASSYSQASWWEMGLLSAQDWKAKWITRDIPLERGDYESAPKWIWAAADNALTNPTLGKHDFRFSFRLAQKPKEATLFITAKDNVAAWVNGKPVVVESPMGNFGRARDPWGYFRVVPVGSLLKAGANSLAAEALVQRERDRPPEGGFIALLRVQMADGKIERFVSGTDWKTGPGQTGNAWVERAFDDSSWPAAAVVAEIGEAPLGTPWPAHPVDLLRRNFSVAKAVRSARIYSTALGTYQLFLNGQRVGNDVLAPGWTDYRMCDPSMNSYNHYAYGAVAEWLYRYAAGIDEAAEDPGFHSHYFHPQFDAALGEVRATYDSAYGADHIELESQRQLNQMGRPNPTQYERTALLARRCGYQDH
jgi:alpha-L-rhamnosidase